MIKSRRILSDNKHLGFVNRPTTSTFKTLPNKKNVYNFKLEESEEDSITENSKFYWMSPDGEFYEVKFGNHYNWAQKYLVINLKIDVNDPRYKGAYMTLYQMGWIRLAVSNFSPESNWLAYNYDKSNPPSQNKIKYLKDFAIESGVHTLIDDTRRKKISIDIDENYRKDYSSDDKDIENHEYFKIGQEDEETTSNSFCWIWSRADQGLRVKRGKTHGANFGHEIAGNTFKGWYDPEKKAISFVFPEFSLRKLGNRKPTVDDIPTIVYRKLQSKFGKDNKFVVFEMITKSKLKTLIKEIIKQYKLLNETSYDIENELEDDKWVYGGWLDPNGKFHVVDREGHSIYAENVLRLLGINKSGGYAYEELYKMRFIRVVFSSPVLYFKYAAYNQNIPFPSTSQIKNLKDLAIEHGCASLHDDHVNRRVTDDLMESVSIDKEKYVKSFLSQMNDDNVVVTVSKEDSLPEASYVQIDGFINGQNVFSSNPEDLVKWGFLVPSVQQFLTLPRGQYKLRDAKSKLKTTLKEEEVRQKFVHDGNNRWWMDTTGKTYDVSKEGHSVWGAKYITNKFGAGHRASQYANSNFNAPYQLLFGAGWVRLLYMTGIKLLIYEYDEIKPSSKQMSLVKLLAKDLGARGIYDERTGKTDKFEENLSEDMSYDDLLKLTTPERKDRASNVTARSLPISTENGLETWNFRYKSSPQTTVTDKPFRGSISFIKGEVGQNDDAMKMKCKVDCECPDFMYRFAYNDAAKGASQVGTDSLSGCLNRRPKPAYDYGEGLCKHLTALGRFLKTKIQATKKSNLFEAIDDVTNQGPFNVTYYD